MLSDTLDILGLACAVAGALILWGLGVALLIACPCLMFISYSVAGSGDVAARRVLGRAVIALRSIPRRRRARPKAV